MLLSARLLFLGKSIVPSLPSSAIRRHRVRPLTEPGIYLREIRTFPGGLTMWIVRLALKRPYTFAVMALLIVVLGATAIRQMRTDIFPEIDIPVVSIIWTYKGMETSEV